MSRLTKPMLFASPEECERAFYEALENADVDAVVDLWLEDDDVVCVHPNGPRLLGFTAVRASWAAILAGGALNVRSTSRKSLDTPTVAVHNVIEEILVKEGSVQQVVSVLATNVYVKTSAGWKMVLHHASQSKGGEVVSAAEPNAILH
jgi:ketosteroid isomerase-like protein